MVERSFVTAGNAPRITRIQALAFHDSAGRIRHMHHAITLEGAEPRSYDSMLEDARIQAREIGVDLARLRVLHVTAPFNLGVPHKVDVKKGVLVEIEPPHLRERRSGSAARPARGTARSAKRR